MSSYLHHFAVMMDTNLVIGMVMRTTPERIRAKMSCAMTGRLANAADRSRMKHVAITPHHRVDTVAHTAKVDNLLIIFPFFPVDCVRS